MSAQVTDDGKKKLSNSQVQMQNEANKQSNNNGHNIVKVFPIDTPTQKYLE